MQIGRIGALLGFAVGAIGAGAMTLGYTIAAWAMIVIGLVVLVGTAIYSRGHVCRALRSMEAFHLILVGLGGMVVFAVVTGTGLVWQRYWPPAQAASGNLKAVRSPQYLSDIQLLPVSAENPNHVRLMMSGTAIHDAPRIRVFVQAVGLNGLPGTAYFNRFLIGESTDTYKEQRLELPVARKTGDKDSTVYWGDPASGRPLTGGPNKLRIILAGPDGEQLAKFLVILSDPAVPLRVITPGEIADLVDY